MIRHFQPWRPWLLAALGYSAWTLVYAWPLLPVLGSALPSDLGDPALNTWILWWNTQAMPFTERWWNAPIFYPQTDAFALSETLIGLTPLTTPLQWMGFSAVQTYNITLLVSYPMAALAAHALAWRLTGRHDAGVLAGVAFGFSPHRAAQLSHLQMLMTCWLPLALLALHLYVSSGRRRWLVLGAVSWMFAGLSTGYYLVYLAVLIGLWSCWYLRERRQWLSVTVAFGIAALLMSPLLVAYKAKQTALGLARVMTEIELFSADLGAVWSASPRGDLLPSYWTPEPGPEGELYPGLVIAVLAVLGLIVAWRARRESGGRTLARVRRILAIGGASAVAVSISSWMTGGWSFSLGFLSISANRPYRPLTIAIWLFAAALLADRRIFQAWRRRSAITFYALAAIVMLVFALGPSPRVFGERFMHEAPYLWLMKLLIGDALRVPARFGVLFMLCLGQAAAIGFARLTPRGASKTLVAVLAGLILLEGYMPAFPIEPVVPPLVGSSLPAGAIVLELPLDHHSSDPKALLRSIGHKRPLINGYSGYQPPHYTFVAEGLRDRLDPDLMRTLQQLGPIAVLVSRDEGVFDEYRTLMDAYPDATRVAVMPAGVLYTLPQRPPPHRDPAAEVQPIARVDANSREANAPLMIDGDITTRWETFGRQRPGQWIKATLAQPARISRIEIEIGEWLGDYPRGLRIEVAPVSGAPAVRVWEGGTAGEAMRAMIADRRRAPMVIDLPAPVEAQEITLTTTSSHIEFSWTIAELKIWGVR